MSSNSIRVGEQLFNSAREEGGLMSRSAAQQIEHWARIGAALEASGLTVTQVIELLKACENKTTEVAEAALWAFKRERQQADLASAEAGRVSQSALSWFPGATARHLKSLNSPY